MSVNQSKIDTELASLDKLKMRLHIEAIDEGHKDEVCTECDTVLLAFHHFIRCESATCPMKLKDAEGHAPSVSEMFIKGVPTHS